jgi:chromosome segregation ATPase
MQQEEEAQGALNSSIQDPNSTEEQLSVAKDALEIKASIVRQAQARVESCKEKIGFILEEIERQGAFVDTESAVLSMAGFEAQDLVLDWTLEMLLASESRIQHVHERCRQLEATIRQLTTTNLDVEGRKSIAEASIHNMNRKMRDKMAELEQMRSDLVISNRSRDKIDQELTAAKEDTRRVTLLLKHSREDVQAEKQQLVVWYHPGCVLQ